MPSQTVIERLTGGVCSVHGRHEPAARSGKACDRRREPGHVLVADSARRVHILPRPPLPPGPGHDSSPLHLRPRPRLCTVRSAWADTSVPRALSRRCQCCACCCDFARSLIHIPWPVCLARSELEMTALRAGIDSSSTAACVVIISHRLAAGQACSKYGCLSGSARVL